MTRWRTKVWLADQPAVSVKATANHDCKLCMIQRVHDAACHVASAMGVDISKVSWQLERYAGHLAGWNIVWTNKRGLPEVIERHGH